jgi:hypothetical protein
MDLKKYEDKILFVAGFVLIGTGFYLIGYEVGRMMK